MRAEKVAKDFVVVAGNIHDPRAVMGARQQLLNDVVMALRPEPAPALPPRIQNVANEVNRVSRSVGKEIQQHVSFAAGGSKMDVGNEQCPMPHLSIRSWCRLACQ
jgi:hypothetical protein